MVILSCSQICKSFDEKPVLTDVSFHVEERDKIGLIGVNGSGKTTLFKILTGLLQADNGSAHFSKNISYSYVEQHISLDEKKTLLDEALGQFSDLIETEKELEEINKRLSGSYSGRDELIARQHALMEKFTSNDGLTYRSRTKAAILGLGFSEEDMQRPLSTFSGGQRSRVALLKMLLGRPSLLLLDEPTNHLDIKALSWLEEYLINYQGAFIVISHDRYFLDRVTNRTFELDGCRLRMFDQSYSGYVKNRDKDREIQARHYENTMREIKRIEGIIEQQKRWNRERNIRTAESKQKMIDRLKKTLVRPDRPTDGISFSFPVKIESGFDVITVRELSKSFGGKMIFDNAEAVIQKNERVFLLGENGCGKTTFMKLIKGDYVPDSGYIGRGANLTIGYYDQDLSGLDQNKDVISEIWDSYPKMTQTEVRSALAVFLFKGDDVFKRVGDLSGGEKARVALLKLMLSGCNFLMLDEPTNHLDLRSREALEQALLDYTGTLLIVSHDRYFINKLADRILYMTPHALLDFDGDYDYFNEHFERIAPEEKQEKKPAGKAQKQNLYLLRREAHSETVRLSGALKRLESRISDSERLIGELQNKLSDPENAADYQLIMESTGQLENETARLNGMYEEWESISGELEKAEQNEKELSE
ncbi:MAG: ABC-F family ATP-binding cassette domain-containing protein [Clostridia bacterium]|nr:ABC-F family ATP-binding cassette domain-containing protein [Clostridia bacterium]